MIFFLLLLFVFKKKENSFNFLDKMGEYTYYRRKSGRFYCRRRSSEGGHVYKYPSNRFKDNRDIDFSMARNIPQLGLLRDIGRRRFKTDYKYEVDVDLVRISRRPNVELFY